MATLLAPSVRLPTEQGWSIVTGLALILMAAAGGFAYGYVHPMLHFANDAKATTSALEASPVLLHIVLVLWTLVVLLDLLVSYGIYVIYRRSAPTLSLLVAAVRLVYTLILIAAVTELGTLLIDGGKGFGLRQFAVFEAVWSGGLVLFGLHLLLLSRLVKLVGYPGSFIAALLALGGLGYVLIRGTTLLGSSELAVPSTIETAFSIPMVLGELFFAICLLISRTLARCQRTS